MREASIPIAGRATAGESSGQDPQAVRVAHAHLRKPIDDLQLFAAIAEATRPGAT